MALDSEVTELEHTGAALVLVALDLEEMELEPMEVAPVLGAQDSGALALVATELDPTAALGMAREVGSATVSEVEALATVPAEMVSGLADLRQSRCWLLLVALALALEVQA